jgi:hypothetical protein
MIFFIVEPLIFRAKEITGELAIPAVGNGGGSAGLRVVSSGLVE